MGKTKVNKLSLFVVIFILLLVGYCGVSFIAKAAPEGLTISPPIVEININQGNHSNQIVRVHNPTKSFITVYPQPMDFQADGEDGNPAFFPPSEGSRNFALSKWFSYNESSLTIAPGERIEFPYKIIVPKDAEPGGHYGAIFFAKDPTQEAGTGNLSVGTMIGELIFLTVNGEVDEKGALEEFTIDKSIYFKNGINLLTRVKNTGNVHYAPSGEIQITSIFGRRVDTLKINEAKGFVLPGSIRQFATNWKSNKLLFGPYKVKLSINQKGDNSLQSEKLIWIVPWWGIAIILGILTMLLYLIRKRRKKRIKSLQ